MVDSTHSFKIQSIGGRVHQAASMGRRMGTFGTRNLGPTDEVTQDLRILIARSRQLRRDNPWVGRAIIVGTANEIGTGIKPAPDTGDSEFNDELKELWVAWSKYADYQGTLTAYGLQAAASIGRKEAGECYLLIRRNRIDRVGESPVPLEFQLVESDQVASDLVMTNLNGSGNRIKNGVETTRNGKILAYWFHKEHPDERDIELLGKSSITNRVRVPVKDVIHHFKPERPSQLRGRPEVVRAIVKSKNYEEYADAELTRKKIRSDVSGVIERPDMTESEYELDPHTGRPVERDHDNTPILNLEPGSFPSLDKGEVLKLFPSDQTGQGYDEFQRWQLLAIAAACNIPYQLITQDYSGINDRLWRAIHNNYKRELQQTQELYVMPQVCDKMWREFVDRAIICGAIVPPVGLPKWKLYRVIHRAQAFEFIHPQQDVDSKIKLMQSGLKSRTSVVDEISGGDESSVTIDAQRAIDLARENELGLTSLAAHSQLACEDHNDESVDDQTDQTDQTDKTDKADKTDKRSTQ